MLVTPQLLHLVARHTDHGTHHLGRRIEHGGLDGKQVFHMVPCLYQHRQDAVLLVARLRGHAYGHLMLNHARTTGNEVAVVKHLKEDLRRDVIGIVACQHKLLTAEHLTKIHTQEIFTQNVFAKLGKVLVQVGHTLTVNLDNLEGTGLFYEILCHDTHAGSHLQYGQLGAGIYRVGNALSY